MRSLPGNLLLLIAHGRVVRRTLRANGRHWRLHGFHAIGHLISHVGRHVQTQRCRSGREVVVCVDVRVA